MKKLIKQLTPSFILTLYYWLTNNRDMMAPIIEKKFNVNLAKKEDFYSPLPDVADLKKNRARWAKPSPLKGVKYDLEQMLAYWQNLAEKYQKEYTELPKYEDNKKAGFGVGFTRVDSRTLYYMLRELKPKKYLEIGSGLSTYYTYLASQKNTTIDNSSTDIKCIEPYPFDKLKTIENIELTIDFVQNVPISKFEELEEGDVLFIDSSHAAKIDSDVNYEILDILPSLKKGVYIHIHDIPFPYNYPYPEDLYIFNRQWPQLWNEPAFVQAFLSFNDTFEVVLSVPLLKFHFDEKIKQTLPDFKNEMIYQNAIGSLWLKKIK